MNKLTGFSLLLTAFLMSGCVIRTIPYEVDRVDQEIKGNRGVIMGQVPPVSEPETRKTREMYNIEIELPMGPVETKPEPKKKIDFYKNGNRGYLKNNIPSENKKTTGGKGENVIRLGGSAVSEGPRVLYKKTAQTNDRYRKEKGSGMLVRKEHSTYLVRKGDTLQKISGKMYGTTKKWRKIYEANRGVLKSPKIIRAGQKLIIPEL